MGKRPVTSGWALTWNLRPGSANASKAPMSWPLKQVLRINRSPPGHFASSWKMECTGLGVWAGQLWVGRPELVRGSKFKPKRKYRGIFFWTEWWQHINEVGIPQAPGLIQEERKSIGLRAQVEEQTMSTGSLETRHSGGWHPKSN